MDMINIPIVHCFDNRYVIAASVAFNSLLRSSCANYHYDLVVFHLDITEENQKKLSKLVENYPNATLEFIKLDTINNSMSLILSELFMQINNGYHFSMEMFIKLFVPELLLKYDYCIVSDVDVLYKNDVSKQFIRYIKNSQNSYIAGISLFLARKMSSVREWLNDVYKDFSLDEQKILHSGIGAGYMFFNLAKMRKDRVTDKLIRFAKENISRLVLPEQDIINLCLHKHIQKLPFSSMIINELYDSSEIIKKTELFVISNPVQLHYSSWKKPWSVLNCAKRDLWYKELCQTDFYIDLVDNLIKKNDENNRIIKSTYNKKRCKYLNVLKCLFKKLH